jgi:hypothetical protein
MIGLEPTTFCMARTLREGTLFAQSRQNRMSLPSERGVTGSERQQPTAKAD